MGCDGAAVGTSSRGQLSFGETFSTCVTDDPEDMSISPRPLAHPVAGPLASPGNIQTL